MDVASVRFGLLSTAPINAEILAAARESEFADVLTVYRRHYNQHRPHRALDLLALNGRDPIHPNQAAATQRVRRHDLLAGVIHGYDIAA